MLCLEIINNDKVNNKISKNDFFIRKKQI